MRGRGYRPFDGDVGVLEAVYDGAAMSLDCVVVGVHNSQQGVQCHVPADTVNSISTHTAASFSALTLLCGLGWHTACKNCPLLSVDAPRFLYRYDT